MKFIINKMAFKRMWKNKFWIKLLNLKNKNRKRIIFERQLNKLKNK